MSNQTIEYHVGDQVKFNDRYGIVIDYAAPVHRTANARVLVVVSFDDGVDEFLDPSDPELKRVQHDD